MILQDTFHYFCKYPSVEAVNKFFSKSGAGEEYELMKARALGTCKEIFPEITDYIFGVDDTQVQNQISMVKGIYLFIDYGNITSKEDKLHVKEDSLQLAVTVAKPLSSGSYDQAEEILITEQLLKIITAIRKDLREDRSDPFIRRLCDDR